eukprot:269871-Hanusia_phi.AAC.1
MPGGGAPRLTPTVSQRSGGGGAAPRRPRPRDSEARPWPGGRVRAAESDSEQPDHLPPHTRQ